MLPRLFGVSGRDLSGLGYGSGVQTAAIFCRIRVQFHGSGHLSDKERFPLRVPGQSVGHHQLGLLLRSNPHALLWIQCTETEVCRETVRGLGISLQSVQLGTLVFNNVSKFSANLYTHAVKHARNCAL